MIYRVISLAALVLIWAKLTTWIGRVVDCRPIDATGVLLLVTILGCAWLLGYMSRRP